MTNEILFKYPSQYEVVKIDTEYSGYNDSLEILMLSSQPSSIIIMRVLHSSSFLTLYTDLVIYVFSGGKSHVICRLLMKAMTMRGE